MSNLDDLIKENEELRRTIADMNAKINKAGWMISGDSLVRIPPKGEVTCDNCGKRFIKRFYKYNSFEHTFCCSKCASEYRKSKKYKTSTHIEKFETYAEIHVYSKKLGKHIVLIDIDKLEDCKDLTFNIVRYPHSDNLYTLCTKEGKQKTLGNYLYGQKGFVVFYKNGNSLDNRKENIELRKRGCWKHKEEQC